ncbi:MAG: LacI family DNA-binding transcriptional regulator [Actinobacteria bacterium]|nr:LacI family DNA-binding transcriptional regulator [Actinomycetota bacterium]
MATLAEIAEHAGVGIGTVSRVFNGSASVSDQMRDRVLEAAAELGYDPGAKKRSQQVTLRGFVGLLVTFFDEPSALQRFSGLVPRLQTNNLHVVLYNIESPSQARSMLVELPRTTSLEALIVVSLPITDVEARALTKAPYPTVLVDTWGKGLPSVTIDDRHGGRIATQHLIDLGHRRIGFVGEPSDNSFGFVSSARREEGYLSALAAAGIPSDPTLIRHGAHLREAAKQMTRDLLELPDPPTAIVAASDVQAVGVMEAAESRGMKVPHDLSVVGYDDIELASLMGLTTVRQPLERSGARAADLVLEAIGSRRRTAFDEQLEVELVVRSTTRPPR